MPIYYVNNDKTNNPGEHHEVHTKEHAEELKIISKTLVGIFNDENEALTAAKKIYSDADGCQKCCPKAHTG